MTQSTVLILGAQGRLGAALVDAFAAQGWRVLAHSRRPNAKATAKAATASVVQIVGDLRDAQAVIQAARKLGAVDVVIHAANVLYARWAAEAVAMNEAAISIATALGATLMLPGNVYNFGTEMPENLRASTAQIARTSKGAIRITMERALADAATHGTQAIVIRGGDYFGCGIGSWFDQAIAKNVHQRKLTYPGPLDRLHTWAYVPDLAATFVRVAQARHTLAAFESIHFAGHAVTGYEFVQTMKAIAPQPLKVSFMPWWLIRAVGVVKPAWRDLAEMSYLWQRPHRLITDPKHAHLIGNTTPLERALRDSLSALHPKLAWRTPSAAVSAPQPVQQTH